MVSIPEGWEDISSEEIRGIWMEQERRKIFYNGCTIAALVDRYGVGNVRHISGRGWIKQRGVLRKSDEQYGEI